MFCSYTVLKGISQSSSPMAAETPTMLLPALGHHLAGAGNFDDDRRRIGRAVAFPTPFFGAGRGIESRERAVCVVSARKQSTGRDPPGAKWPRRIRTGRIPCAIAACRSWHRSRRECRRCPSVKIRPSATTGVDFTPCHGSPPPDSRCRARRRTAARWSVRYRGVGR